MEKVLSTSELLEQMAENHPKPKISFREIKRGLHERGFGILFLVFAIPLLIPLPLPTGLGTALSIPLFFFSYQFTINAESPWLPKWILRKEFAIETFRKMVGKALPYLRYVEKFLKKRLIFITESRKWEIFIGIFILSLQVPIAMPMPMSNTIPAAGIILIALGMLEKDGLMILIGTAIGFIAWLVFIFMCGFVFYGASELYQYIPEDYRDDIKKLVDPLLINNEQLNNIDNDSENENLPLLEDDPGIAK